MDPNEAISKIEAKLHECIISGIEGIFPWLEEKNLGFLVAILANLLREMQELLLVPLAAGTFEFDIIPPSEALTEAANIADELCGWAPTMGDWNDYKEWLRRVAEMLKLLADALEGLPEFMQLVRVLRMLAAWLMYVWQFT